MPLKKQIRKISAEVRHIPNKMQGIINVTHFDRLMQKYLIAEELEMNLPQNYRLQMFFAYMATQVLQLRSQRDFIEQLRESNAWQRTLGFTTELPVQSTFSRYWNSPAYHDSLDEIFLALQKLIGLKKVHFEYEAPPELVRILHAGYFPLSVDASFISLSEKRFTFAEREYSAMEKGIDTGAKINLIIDGLLNMPVDYIPTPGNVHETTSLNVVIDDLLSREFPWMNKRSGKILKFVLILDRGYWDKKRFMQWTENNIGFLCPRKRKVLTVVQIEWLDFTAPETAPLEGLVWIDPIKDPLRWVIAKSTAKGHTYWDLITNCFDLTVRDLITAYRDRWPIEEIFKWMKQYTNIKRPLIESWDGFVFHCYCIMILLLLLQYFLALLGIPRWQDNLTEL